MELSEQLSSEVHRLDVRIDDVSTAIDAINASLDNDDDIQDLHDEIHEVATALDAFSQDASTRLNYLTQKAINHDDAYAELDEDIDQMVQTVADIDADLHEEIHEVATKLDLCCEDASTRLNYLTQKANSHDAAYAELDEDIDQMAQTISDMDTDIHAEIHAVATKLDACCEDASARLNYLTQKVTSHDTAVTDLNNDIDFLTQGMSDMNDDFHEEIYDISTGLSNVTAIVNNLPPHIVLTKEEYDDLDNPDYNSFYFTYEDDE